MSLIFVAVLYRDPVRALYEKYTSFVGAIFLLVLFGSLVAKRDWHSIFALYMTLMAILYPDETRTYLSNNRIKCLIYLAVLARLLAVERIASGGYFIWMQRA
jgi:hypothetical protein